MHSCGIREEFLCVRDECGIVYGASLSKEGGRGKMCGVGVSVAIPCMCRVITCGIRDE